MRGILVSDERKLFIQAVLDGQISESYITDKEVNFIYRELWEKMIDPLLPQYSYGMSYN
jgi:hypothetical protein